MRVLDVSLSLPEGKGRITKTARDSAIRATCELVVQKVADEVAKIARDELSAEKPIVGFMVAVHYKPPPVWKTTF